MQHEHIIAFCKKNAIAWEKKNCKKFHCEVVRGQETFIKLHTYYPFALWAALEGSDPPQAKKCYIFTILATLAIKLEMHCF